ncbi:uncharacterized protein LOC113432433 isoform X2 [Notechis scutatus]|uniref:Uncharacterized protein LOC113432433 isoform X2 n=1 Tax=Notechis scutatus TaxID=8663 RepID=A0A6J1W5H0_9SAUR|nr:uncharacterized protein LOC113432433 isoform X2 [Notechis scutatus]
MFSLETCLRSMTSTTTSSSITWKAALKLQRELGAASWKRFREDFQMYEKYCQNKPQSESLWRQHAESLFFQVLCLSTASTINGIHFETFRGFPSAENVGGVITEF